MTRSMGRRHALVRLAAAGAALAGMTLLSACSAGQLAETSRIVPAVPGGGATVEATSPNSPNGAIMVQNASIPFKSGGYQPGEIAPISMWVTNNTNEQVTLSPSTGPALLRDSQGVANIALGSLSWQAGTGVSTAPNATPVPGAVVPGATASPAAAPPAPTFGPLTIGPNETIQVTPDEAQFLGITLQQALSAGNVTQIGLTFQGTSQQFSATVVVPVAPPLSAQPRVSATPATP